MGRHYCYAPAHYLGTAWFWPGKVPWKMMAIIGAPLPGPWHAIEASGNVMSDPVQKGGDLISAEYIFHVPADTTDYFIRLNLKKAVLGPYNYQAFWQVQLWVPIILLSDGATFQPFPQRSVSCPQIDNSTDSLPPYTTGPVPIGFRPATWAESGSPWSN